MDWVIGIAVVIGVLLWLTRDKPERPTPPRRTPPPPPPPMSPTEEAYEDGLADGIALGYFGSRYWLHDGDHHALFGGDEPDEADASEWDDRFGDDMFDDDVDF